MENKKAYFVKAEEESIFELSASKRKQLEKKHPDWYRYNSEKNYNELHEVYEFFKTNGKLLAGLRSNNLFVGLLE